MAIYDLEKVLNAATKVLFDAGASIENARAASTAMVQAEAEGNPICGLFHLPNFVKQIQAGRVKGKAEPKLVSETPAAAVVDAGESIAHSALHMGVPLAAAKAKQTGIAALSVVNAYHTLALGHFTAMAAQEGLVAMMFSNAPKAQAPLGAKQKIFGTNPLSMAAPMADGGIMLIDQASSAATKTKIEMVERAGDSMPDGWAQTKDGQPTNDPAEGLAGSILPNGGTRGANIAMMVEVLAAMVTGGNISAEAPMFGDVNSDHPRLGMFMIFIDPAKFGGATYMDRMSAFTAIIDSEEALRMPGARRAQALETAKTHGLKLTDAQAKLLHLDHDH